MSVFEVEVVVVGEVVFTDVFCVFIVLPQPLKIKHNIIPIEHEILKLVRRFFISDFPLFYYTGSNTLRPNAAPILVSPAIIVLSTTAKIIAAAEADIGGELSRLNNFVFFNTNQKHYFSLFNIEEFKSTKAGISSALIKVDY